MMQLSSGPTDLAVRAALAIRDGFVAYHTSFKTFARRAQARFEARDWRGGQQDSVERLDLYKQTIDTTLAIMRAILQDHAQDHAVWRGMKRHYTELIAQRDDIELAETFFNSITRRIFTTVGVDPDIEFVASGPRLPLQAGTPVYDTYWGGSIRDLIRAVLQNHPFQCGYETLDYDTQQVAAAIEAHLLAECGVARIDTLEMIRAVFYRNKGAYLVGRIISAGRIVPIILPLLHTERGVFVDTVLLTEDDALLVFGVTRSYFQVEAERPSELIAFLKSIMPRKHIAELYTSIGYNKHGKTELYRDLVQHLAHSNDLFEEAQGTKGMVMSVFTLPSYDVVFKIIKDRFAPPKTSTREDVLYRYQLVFRHDRAGRLIDAQEFEHLEFDKARFTPSLLEELTTLAANTVSVQGDRVIIRHLYTERRVTPLDVYVRESDADGVRDAVIDYGEAIKDLASTNIFPGDLFLKNFGVTRHHRVVFYDYDELCLLTDCNFRRIPVYDDGLGDFGQEPWFSVHENDIFPEEFQRFLGLPRPLQSVFHDHHGYLFDAEFWQHMQGRHRAGEVLDIFPYKQSKRFPHPQPV